MSFEGLKVLVTGSTRGIGRATAAAFHGEGATVVVHGRRDRDVARTVDELGGERLGAVAGDLSTRAVCTRMVEAAIADMGHVDVVINNAGLGGEVPVVDMTDDQWDAVLDITLNSVFRMTRAVLPHMMERRSGVIVNNASVLGWRAQEGQAHYAAAKAGVMALTRCTAMEAAESGVRVNAVSPSIATHEFLAKVTPPGLLEELTAREAFGRGAEPWEVANVIVFLASDYASYMTGECVSVSSQHP